MDSDIDMFNSQPTDRIYYGNVILFDWDPAAEKPFQMYSRTEFANHEIRDYWMENKLLDKWRIKKLLPLSALPGLKLSLFARVDSSKFKL